MKLPVPLAAGRRASFPPADRQSTKRNPPLLFHFLLAAAALALWAGGANVAHAQIEIRVSVKRFLDANGNPPTNGYPVNLEDIRKDLDYSNFVLDRAGRGYRFRLLEIVDLAGLPEWFDGPGTKAELEALAEADPATFGWRFDAINVYINGTDGGGTCSFPNSGEDLIIYGRNAGALIYAHEIGHYFNLLHPFEGGSCCNFQADPGCADGCDRATDPMCTYTFGDDGLSDTLPDLPCGTRDDLATNAFGLLYANLSTAQRRQVDSSFYNVMGYHDPFAANTNFTTLQLDRWTDAANTPRNAVVTGRTRFVDRSATEPSNGSSTAPYRTVGAGVTNASGGDIVLVRAGNYNEPQTIRKAVTLRATRGNALIGKP